MDVAFPIRMIGFRRGGGAIWALKIAEKLEELGVNVTFVVAKPINTPIPEPITEFPSIEVPTPHLQDIAYAAPPGIGGVISDIDSYMFNKRVAKELKNKSFDIVNVHSLTKFSRFVNDLTCPVVIKLSGPPHSLFYDVVHPFNSSYTLLEKFNAIITTGITTQNIKDNLHVTCGSDIKEINPGVDTSVFTPGDGGDRPGKNLLFVGRFVPAKNISRLLGVFKSINEKHSEATLKLVGDGPKKKQIERKIDSLGLSDSVELPGYISNEDLPLYYREADVFVLSSKTENHPITVLEAMSCETPVVAPKTGAIPDIIEHSDNGLLYDSDEEFKKFLNQFLSQPELRQQYGQRGRQTAVSEFEWKEKAKELKSLYDSLIKE